jgi:hypothetical protein
MPDVTERPTLNVFKLHGSLTWKMNPANFTLEYRDYHAAIFEFYNRFKDIFNPEIVQALELPVRENIKEKAILKIIKKHFSGHDKKLEGKEESFIEAFFSTFVIVDPFIRKFHTEAVETHYFKLLRLMSSEIEKDNAALFIFGFSFRDDHIRHIIEHQLKNDNLKVYIFCYDEAEIARAETFFGSFNDKMHLITPIKSNFTLTDFNDLLNLINSK